MNRRGRSRARTPLVLAVGATLTVLTALTGCSDASDDASAGDLTRTTVLSDHLTKQPPSASFRFSDAHPEDVTSVVVLCPYTDPAALDDELARVWQQAGNPDLDEAHQAVLTFGPSGARTWEVLERRQLDLCGDDSADPGARLDPDTTLEVLDVQWSNGTSSGPAAPTVRYR